MDISEWVNRVAGEQKELNDLLNNKEVKVSKNTIPLPPPGRIIYPKKTDNVNYRVQGME